MRIAMIGAGYVGLVSAACFAEFGVQVVALDQDQDKIEGLLAGQMPIYEPGLDEVVARNVAAGRLAFTTDLAVALDQVDAIFIAVGTPSRRGDGHADLRYLFAAAESIAKALDHDAVVVTKSTVPVGTGRRLQALFARERPDLQIEVASNPEFLREGSAIEDFMRPNRVVLGTEDEQSAAILKDLYRPLYLIETPIVVTDVITAEMIKYASNAFLATKISFINEMANLCEATGADVHGVAKGMGLDRRIGSKFLHPGPGYGGSCFPKDTRAIVEVARDHGVKLQIVNAVIGVNDARPPQMVEKIRRAVGGELKGKTIGLLGLTFKPNTDDLRESPAMAILDQLVDEGAKVRAFDPIALPIVSKSPRPGVDYCEDEYEVAKGSDALVLATEWNQFRGLDLNRVKELLASPTVIDLRNVYEPETMRERGFDYTGVGR
jgi:UDPglucose 6-dehydrogenase